MSDIPPLECRAEAYKRLARDIDEATIQAFKWCAELKMEASRRLEDTVDLERRLAEAIENGTVVYRPMDPGRQAATLTWGDTVFAVKRGV